MDSPKQSVAEVTLIGTGGGYGESSVVHLGNNDWIIVDSCINPETNKSLPLEYLTSIGVNVASDVKVIVCSHWHGDHIRGMSELLKACTSAEFFFASCTDKEKFLTFIEIDAGKHIDNNLSSSTIEFFNCLQILIERGKSTKRAVVDRLIFSSNKGGIKCDVFSISPSDATLTEFDNEISMMIEVVKQRNKKFVDKSPNTKSVVLYIKLNEHRIILGADLEVTNQSDTGWHNILNNSKAIDKNKANLFKVPHHGSENGYLKDLWGNLLEKNSITTITAYNRGTTLPQMEMLKKYAIHTENIYLTTNPTTMGSKAKQREPSIEKMIREKNPTLREIKFKEGIIRCRTIIDGINEKWEVTLFGQAIYANKVFVNELK